MYLRKDFCEYERCDFEGNNWKIPKEYDKYLTHMYGDYMKIPDERNREKHVVLEFKLDQEGKNMIEIIKNWYGLILFYLFRIFSITRQNCIFQFYGENYEGNPKYISDYLLEKRKDIKQVWINHTKRKFNLDPSIKTVKWGSIKMIYEMATAKIWVDSHTKPIWIKKERNNYILKHGMADQV